MVPRFLVALCRCRPWTRVVGFAVFCCLLTQGKAETSGTALAHGRDSRRSFRTLMPQTVVSRHPAMVPIAAAIRTLTDDPLEQIAAVHQVTRLWVDYDSDQRLYGKNDYHATLDEMITQRAEHGWSHLRDDCDGRAVFAAHLLSALGLPWRLEASYWKRHAWVSVAIDGVRYDLLDLPEDDPALRSIEFRWIGQHVTRPSRPPPMFDVRQAWRERMRGDLELGARLGLLAPSASGRGWEPRYPINWLELDRQETLRAGLAGSGAPAASARTQMAPAAKLRPGLRRRAG